MQSLKTDLEQDEVFVFTPKGRVVTLPLGSTTVDFAYAVHTEVGHACIGAKVNGRLVSLDHQLSSGDTCEIFTSKVETAGPSQDWLGFVESPRARNKIRQWFSRERRLDMIEQGRDELAEELRREGLPVQRMWASDQLKAVIAEYSYVDLDALLAAIGEHHVSARGVAQRVARGFRGGDDEEQLPATVLRPRRHRTQSDKVGVHVEGLDDVLVRLAKCCTPVPGDEIIGFVTRGRGVSVHRADCANAVSLMSDHATRLIEVDWDGERVGRRCSAPASRSSPSTAPGCCATWPTPCRTTTSTSSPATPPPGTTASPRCASSSSSPTPATWPPCCARSSGSTPSTTPTAWCRGRRPTPVTASRDSGVRRLTRTPAPAVRPPTSCRLTSDCPRPWGESRRTNPTASADSGRAGRSVVPAQETRRPVSGHRSRSSTSVARSWSMAVAIGWMSPASATWWTRYSAGRPSVWRSCHSVRTDRGDVHLAPACLLAGSVGGRGALVPCPISSGVPSTRRACSHTNVLVVRAVLQCWHVHRRRLPPGAGGPQLSDLLLQRVRPWPRVSGGDVVDVLIRAGRIAAIGTDGVAPDDPDLAIVDGAGGVLLPALADVHAHLDSTRLGLPFRPHTAGPGLAGLIENDRANWRAAGDDVAARATRTLGATIASGVTIVRSHAQVDGDSGLERLEGVLAAREAHAARCRVQVVAFPQSGILRDAGTAGLLDAAMRAGADLVGGIDPCAFDHDPVAHLDVVFGLAERHRAGVDIHLHETGELGAFTVELIAERTVALGMEGQVTISHAFALSSVDAARQAALVDLLADCRHRRHDGRPRHPRAVAAGARCGRPVCASGSARTASVTTGRHTATATSSSEPGSWRSAPATATTS